MQHQVGFLSLKGLWILLVRRTMSGSSPFEFLILDTILEINANALKKTKQRADRHYSVSISVLGV
jgi:hypothetical protein